MLRDWVKMRTDLFRDPKVILMADMLAKNFVGDSNVTRNVTRNVMRNATVGALVTVWGVLRHLGRRDSNDLLIPKAQLSVIDGIAEMEGMGEAMAFVGWAEQVDNGVILPEFFAENNVDPSDDSRAKAAERQRNYRKNKKRDSDVTRDGDSDVTGDGKGDDREEESRAEDNSGGARADGQDKPFVPRAVDTPECHAAFSAWCNYLEQSGLDVMSPRTNSIQAEMIWRNAHRLGADKWIKCVELSIRNGYKQIIQNPDRPKGETKKDFDPDFLKAVRVCKEFPSGSDFDRQKREELLGPVLIRIVRHITTARLAEVDRFTQKAMAAEWEIVRESVL